MAVGSETERVTCLLLRVAMASREPVDQSLPTRDEPEEPTFTVCPFYVNLTPKHPNFRMARYPGATLTAHVGHADYTAKWKSTSYS